MNNYAVIQEHLEQVTSDSNTLAAEAAGKTITALNLDNLSDEDKLLKVHSGLRTLKLEIDDFPFPEYIHLANYKNAVEKLFYSRLLFFNRNESAEVKKALILHHKLAALQKHYHELKIKLCSGSGYLYNDFISGKTNVVFYHLNECPLNTPYAEYLRMRTWQNKKLLELVQLETTHLIETFRHRFIAKELSAFLPDQEIEQLQTLFRNPHKNWLGLRTQLSRLIAMENSDLPVDGTAFINAFNKFLTHNIDKSALTPANLQKYITHYRSPGRIKPFSFAPAGIYSLICYGEWLEKIKNGSISINQNLTFDYDSLFEQTCNKALLQGEKNIEAFRANIDIGFSAEEYRNYILNRLDNLRYALKEIENVGYFNLLDSPDSLRVEFISNCIFRKNPDIQAKQLFQAIAINEEAASLLEKFQDMLNLPGKLNAYNNIRLHMHLQLINLVLDMVPDSGTLNRLLALQSNTLTQLTKSRKPVLFILRDIKDELTELFEQAEMRLLKLLDNHNRETVLEFAAEKLKQLQRQMLNANEKKFSYYENLNHLTELLKIEVECLKILPGYNAVNLEKLLKPAASNKNKLTFGLIPAHATELEKIIQALCLRINLLDNRTSVGDLMHVFKSKDLSEVTKQIYLDCETTQFRYIIDRLNPWFESLTLKAIEQSKLFFSRNDVPITATNLSRNRNKNPKQKDKIDNCFN